MAIGTVDYVSTAPWNSPYNPWPAYAQVQATYEQGDTKDVWTLTLSAFSANNDIDLGFLATGLQASCLYYVNNPVEAYLFYMKAGYAALNWPAGWAFVNADGNNIRNETTARATPSKPAGIADGWIQIDSSGGQAEDISIVPVTSVLTPWELRRRRLLELC